MVHLAGVPRGTLQSAVLLRLEGLLQNHQARAVAGRGKVNEVTISNWRRGKVAFNPRLETLEKLAEGLGITVAELIGEAPTFEEKLRLMTADEKLALLQRLAAELQGRS
jgi:transcriptional regulator with XRE-family HTH domain